MTRKHVVALKSLVLAAALLCSVSADAARGRRASIDNTPSQMQWDSENLCTLSDAADGVANNHEACTLRPTADGGTFGDRSTTGVFTPIALPGDMKLLIGGKTYTHF